MNRHLREHRKLLRKQGLELKPADERSDFLITLSNLPWGKISQIATILAIGGATAVAMSQCVNFIDSNHVKFVENYLFEQQNIIDTLGNHTR